MLESLTPKSLDVKRGGNFAIAKICDAFYGQVDLIVSCFFMVHINYPLHSYHQQTQFYFPIDILLSLSCYVTSNQHDK